MQAFFTLAAVSPNRQRAFRTILVAHLLAMGLVIVAMLWRKTGPLLFGNVLLVAGIIEGALLIGWRLTQLPKSQALEFLLVSAARPPFVLVAEAAVGITRLAFVTTAGLPLLILMVTQGLLLWEDVPVLLALPFAWGLTAGLGLVTWAYEPMGVRRWTEKLAIAGVLVYLVVGVLAGERLPYWLAGLPSGWGDQIVATLRMLHDYNPFGAMQFAMENAPVWTWERTAWVTTLGVCLSAGFLLRCAWRLKGHFHDEHYRPNVIRDERGRAPVGDEPLTWWAVKRVGRYAGQINVWLAGGFGFVYAARTIAGPDWPDWLGSVVFQLFDRVGGLPMLATAVMMLATVPAAFQYGLWDSSIQDRCRRLELLLLTKLEGTSYWQAAVTAAWRRSRGYFVIALMMWLAAALGGAITGMQAVAGLTAGIILWGFYFTLGFRAFSRGVQANRLGTILTLLLPLATFVLAKSDWPRLAVLLPPGSVYFGSTAATDLWWMIGPLCAGVFTLLLVRRSLERCDGELRAWYDRNHGLKASD